MLEGWIVCGCLCDNRNEGTSCYLVPNADIFIIQVESVIKFEVYTQGRWVPDYHSSGSWKMGIWKYSGRVSAKLRKINVKLI